MKKYFIKTIMKATVNNDTYCGNIFESIWGKNYNWIENFGSHATESNCVVKLDLEKAKKVGFSSVKEVKNSSVYKSAMENIETFKNSKIWETLLIKIIAIDL